MRFSRAGLAVASMALLLAGGCSSTRFSNMDSTRPEPLPAAPSGTISTSQLPPPVSPGTAAASSFPTAPQQNGQVASLPPDGTAPAGAADLTPASVAGVWSVNVSGQSCKVATPQTKFGQGYRAGPLRCPAPVDGVKSWNVSGKQLTLYDQDGGTLARLYSSGAGRFDGQTSSGQPIALTR